MTTPDDRLRGLPLDQPFATLVVRGLKVQETRSKPPAKTILGRRVAIHACVTTRTFHLCSRAPFSDVGLKEDELPLGGIIGTVFIAGFEPITAESSEQLRADNPREYAFGNYTPGRYAWHLQDARELPEPIPYRPNSQGLYFVPPGLAEQINNNNPRKD